MPAQPVESTSTTTPPSRTVVRRHIAAPRAEVYHALLDPVAVAAWKVPDGMRCEVHRFEPWEGGLLRISLIHESDEAAGKSSSRADTYQGRFVRLVPEREVVEIDTFETDDPELQGVMTSSITLRDAEGGGTEVEAVHDGVPASIPPEQNEAGWRMALAQLARWVEGGDTSPGNGQPVRLVRG